MSRKFRIITRRIPARKKKNFLKDYGFIVKFKKGTSIKERQRIIKLVLKEKCVDNVGGALTLRF
jgi:CRISPR/Cas system-associated protein Csx1